MPPHSIYPATDVSFTSLKMTQVAGSGEPGVCVCLCVCACVHARACAVG